MVVLGRWGGEVGGVGEGEGRESRARAGEPHEANLSEIWQIRDTSCKGKLYRYHKRDGHHRHHQA